MRTVIMPTESDWNRSDMFASSNEKIMPTIVLDMISPPSFVR